MKTLEMKVTAHDLRSTFGNVVDYVLEEATSLVAGWTHDDVRSHNYIGGVEVWEIDLKNRDEDEEVEIIADVYIQFYGMDNDTPDEKVVAEVSIDVR